MSRTRPFLAFGAGVLMLLFVAGCSGGDSSVTASASGGNAGTSINLAESAAKIGTLESFRFKANASINFEASNVPSTAEDAFGAAFLSMFLGGLDDVQIEGAVVAPDQLELTVKLGGQTFGFVQIGDEAWANYLGSWQPIAPEDLGLEGGLDFSDLTSDEIPAEVLDAAKVTNEKVGGLNTTRYSFDKAALESLAEEADSGQDLQDANMDVWLTDDGIPVKLALKMAGTDADGQKSDIELEFTMSDLNKDISIKAPR